MEPTVVRPDAAHQIDLYDVHFAYGVGAAESDGRLAALEVTIPPKTLIKPHVHTREDEFSFVIEGSIGVRQGDATADDLPAGSWLIKPRTIPHAMWNVGDTPARVLEIVSPGGLESYFEQIAPILREHGPDWTRRYDALAGEFGLTILNDWTDELKAKYGITL